MSESTSVQKAEYLLKTMLFDPSKAAQLGVYDWASESSRWNELLTIIMSRICDVPEEDLRDLTKYLSDLGHLDIEQLARINVSGDEIDRSDEEATKILDVFRRKGVTEEQALRILLLFCQIARGLNSNFGGKIQRYLRSYGDQMLKDIPKYFSLKSSSDDEIQQIFTLWFQKVLNMPVPLRDPILSGFCHKNDISTDELLEAADNINLNVAIVDEMLRLESASEGGHATRLVPRQ
jgi:hypothetical protein